MSDDVKNYFLSLSEKIKPVINKSGNMLNTTDTDEDADIFFQCNKCGLCCQHVDNFKADDEQLDRGDGTCRYFEEETRLCSIYNDRPLICRIEDFYNAYLKDSISKNEYYDLNRLSCIELKKKYGR